MSTITFRLPTDKAYLSDIVTNIYQNFTHPQHGGENQLA